MRRPAGGRAVLPGAGGESSIFLKSSFCLTHAQMNERTSFFLRASQGTWTLNDVLWETPAESDEARFEIQTNPDLITASLGNGCVGGRASLTS